MIYCPIEGIPMDENECECCPEKGECGAKNIHEYDEPEVHPIFEEILKPFIPKGE
jgi:hypothetical protein